MRIQALLALLTMFALAFAGCAGDAGEPEQDEQPSATQTTTQASATSTTASSSPTSASSTTTAAQPPANKPPTGSISATVNGTNASFSLTGSDPDGETIVWDLDFGDGATTSGTELPATVDHTYGVGNFTATFTITDGKAPATYSVTVAVDAGADLPLSASFAGTATGMCQLFDPTTFESICLPEGSVIEHEFPMVPSVQKIVVLLGWEFEGPVVTDLDIYVYDASGAEVGSSTCANVDPLPDPSGGIVFSCVRGLSEEATIEGISVPADETWKVVIVPYQAPMIDYTLTVAYS